LNGFFCFFGLRIDGLHRLGCYRRRWSHRLFNNLPMDAMSSPLAPHSISTPTYLSRLLRRR
jgi:hypothetical protein